MGTDEIDMNTREEIGRQINAEIMDEIYEEDWEDESNGEF
jgi:hypothetical protein